MSPRFSRLLLSLVLFFTLHLLTFAGPLHFQSCPLFTNRPATMPQLFGGSADEKQTTPASILTLLEQTQHFAPNSHFLLNSKELQELIANYQRRDPFVSQQAQNNATADCECATPLMPFKHPDHAQSLRVFVKRLLAPVQPDTKRNALFLLSGGPGGSSDIFEPIMLLLRLYLPNHDIYYLEHRGVGRSARLGCTAVQAETMGSDSGVAISNEENRHCAAQMDEYFHDETDVFSATQAAEDLKSVVTQLRGDYDGDMTVYGISYGTFWAQRFLQLDGAPNGVDKVILDGVVSQKSSPGFPLSRTVLTNWDTLMNEVGMRFMEICDADRGEDDKNANSCRVLIEDRLGEISTDDKEYKYTNGKDFVELVFREVFHEGKCKTQLDDGSIKDHWGFTEDETRSMIGSMLQQASPRTLIPALLLRLLRCDDDQDYGVFAHIRTFVQAQKNATLLRTSPGLASPVLGSNIMFAELWDRELDPTYDDLRLIFNSSYFASGIYVSQPAFEVWPKYDEPRIKTTFENIDIPILMLNGDLDPQTPFLYAEAVYNNTHTSCPNLKLFQVPYAPHFTLMNSPYAKPEDNRPKHCGMDLMVQFTKNGFTDLDTSCLERVTAPNFQKGDELVGMLLFGTHDIWDGSWLEPEQKQTVDLYVFIAAQAGTVIVGIVIICALVYVIVRLRDRMLAKEGGYTDLDEQE